MLNKTLRNTNSDAEVYLDERQTSSIVCDCQAKCILGLYDVNNFWSSTNVSKNKIVESKLSSK